MIRCCKINYKLYTHLFEDEFNHFPWFKKKKKSLYIFMNMLNVDFIIILI